ncbi:MAG TPA: ParB/RepB/Spo0J family partition protein [Planctomycetota bacterium]|nr:ParB/RepB/Spo0J family partition protein [Planctomycetota bacterium]
MGKRKLGRGLGALLGRHTAQPDASERVFTVSLDEIEPNPWQPRKAGPDDELAPLVDSIRANGVLQPIVLRRRDDGGYQIVAGERRWRASREAGVSEIPSVIRNVPDDQMLLLALLENIVREDLDPIERANGYVSVMRDSGWTQEQLSKQLGEARATVANVVRLLELPEEIQDLVSRGTLSAGHGRAILALRDPQAQARLCQRILRDGLSVRQAEQIVSGAPPGARKAAGRPVAPHIRELQDRLAQALGASVIIRERKKGGRIIIDFKTHDDFDRILALVEQPPSTDPEVDGFHV